MAKANLALLSQLRDLVDRDGCFTGTPAELADRCDDVTPMEIGRSLRNPVMVNAFTEAGYDLTIGKHLGRSVITISRS
jgi:hypothetical protein